MPLSRLHTSEKLQPVSLLARSKLILFLSMQMTELNGKTPHTVTFPDPLHTCSAVS